MVKKTTYIAPVTNAGGVKTFTPSTAQILGKQPDPCLPPSSPPGTHKFPQTYPIHVTASTTLQSNSAGGVNSVSLKNPMGQPMEILEIKFSLYQSELSTGNMGGVIACKLDLGNFPITNGFVPVWNFGRSENLFAENISDSNNISAQNEFTWRLPHPLYVASDAVLVPTFQHRGNVQFDIQVRISYSARSVPIGTPPPKKVILPYAASYTAMSYDVNGSGSTQSLETDLVNPFDEPIYLQRFTGRTATFYNDISPPTLQDAGPLGETTGAQQYKIRMVDSFGRQIVRTPIPFRLVFSGVTRSWEIDNAIMDPRSFILVYLRKDVPAQGATSGNFLTQAFVGLVGYRVVVGGAS